MVSRGGCPLRRNPGRLREDRPIIDGRPWRRSCIIRELIGGVGRDTTTTAGGPRGPHAGRGRSYTVQSYLHWDAIGRREIGPERLARTQTVDAGRRAERRVKRRTGTGGRPGHRRRPGARREREQKSTSRISNPRNAQPDERELRRIGATRDLRRKVVLNHRVYHAID